jgi:hypothetical protein
MMCNNGSCKGIRVYPLPCLQGKTSCFDRPTHLILLLLLSLYSFPSSSKEMSQQQQSSYFQYSRITRDYYNPTYLQIINSKQPFQQIILSKRGYVNFSDMHSTIPSCPINNSSSNLIRFELFPPRAPERKMQL